MPLAMRKRSARTVCGLPLFDIAFGPDAGSGQRFGRARGIVAIGDTACGWLAVGGRAWGIVAIGGVAGGLVAVGGLAIGLLAIAGLAIGGLVLGGCAVGIDAYAGGLAVGYRASGTVAIGYYARGLQAWGKHTGVATTSHTPEAIFAAQGAEIDRTVLCEDRTAGGDPMKRYFLIRHKLEPKETPKEYGLLLVLPGGPGSEDFLPFCANVLSLAGTPKDVIVAELVAPVWSWGQSQNCVWPSDAFPSADAKFTSEQFVDAVIEDVGKQYNIHPGWVFSLGWSSSGHVIYSSSFENPKIRGSFVAMSRFMPQLFAHPQNAKGKRYYFWHSPDNAICPYAESEAAVRLLTKYGASTIIKSYNGGHGWVPFTFYGDRIQEAIEWFRASDANADKVKARIEVVPERGLESGR